MRLDKFFGWNCLLLLFGHVLTVAFLWLHAVVFRFEIVSCDSVLAFILLQSKCF